MKRETLCFDTSVLSAYYDERAKDRQEATIKFWENVLPNYKVYISEITVKELEDTKDKTLRRKFKSLIKGFKVLKQIKRLGIWQMLILEGECSRKNTLMMPFM